MRKKTEKQTRRKPAPKSRAQDAMPPDLPPAVIEQDNDAEDTGMPIVDYIARAFPHCVCPKCRAGDPRIYKTRQYGARATLRYHLCYCGLRLKSMESW